MSGLNKNRFAHASLFTNAAYKILKGYKIFGARGYDTVSAYKLFDEQRRRNYRMQQMARSPPPAAVSVAAAAGMPSHKDFGMNPSMTRVITPPRNEKMVKSLKHAKEAKAIRELLQGELMPVDSSVKHRISVKRIKPVLPKQPVPTAVTTKAAAALQPVPAAPQPQFPIIQQITPTIRALMKARKKY